MRLRDIHNRQPLRQPVFSELITDWTSTWSPRDWEPAAAQPRRRLHVR